MTAAQARDLGLESILWLAEAQKRKTSKLRGVHARASRLPVEWWLSHINRPIELIILAVEQEKPVAEPDLRVSGSL